MIDSDEAQLIRRFLSAFIDNLVSQAIISPGQATTLKGVLAQT